MSLQRKTAHDRAPSVRPVSARAVRTGAAPLLAAVLVALATACGTAPEKPAEEARPEKIAYPPPPAPPRFFYEASISNTGQVIRPTERNALQYALTGQSGISGRPFAKPFSVAVHEGRVFLSDTVARIVWALDFPQQKVFEVGRSEPGSLAKPFGVDVDASGRLYVIDGSFKRVTVYDRDGAFLRTFGGKELFDRPSGIAVTPDGSRVFVVDTGGVQSANHRVRVFDGASGEHLRDIGSRGSAEGQFNLPREAEIGPDGRLYVVDGGNFRVQVFEQDGTFVRAFGEVGRRSGQFSRPKGISLDPQGNVYVTDTAFGNFQIFSPSGELLMWIGQRGAASRPGLYMLPAGIDVDEDGRVYFVDQYFRRFDIFRPAGLEPGEGHLARREAAGGTR